MLSKNWISVLETNNKTCFISGYKFDLNGHRAGSVLDDKYALYDVLKYKKIPVVEHKIIFNNYNKKEILDFFNSYNKNVVIKPNNGTCGNNVFHINDPDELFNKINLILKSNFSMAICPFYEIETEYRVIVLNDQVQIIYGKKKPIVVGDGSSSLKELLTIFNPNYFSNLIVEDYIPKLNEKIEYGWQFNLSKGSTVFLLDNINLINKLEKIATSVTESINIKFCSVDIIETVNKEYLVLECNSGVMMDNFIDLIEDGYEIAKNIYSKAIDEMFK